MTVGGELAALGERVRLRLDDAHRAREVGLAECRRVVRACGQSIRAVHRGEMERAAELAADAEQALGDAQRALAPHPAVAYGGPLQDAQKEYVEARRTAVLVAGGRLPSHEELGVEVAAWLGGLCEAASELRRHLLDRLRLRSPASRTRTDPGRPHPHRPAVPPPERPRAAPAPRPLLSHPVSWRSRRG